MGSELSHQPTQNPCISSPTTFQAGPQVPGVLLSPPCALLWNKHLCPEGRLVPLRQAQPPVYFYQPTSDTTGIHFNLTHGA